MHVCPAPPLPPFLNTSNFKIYLCNITLNITAIFSKHEILFLSIVPYADNSFPRIPYIALH